MSAECVYQWRKIVTDPCSPYVGDWTPWQTCTAEEYSALEKLIADRQPYEGRIVEVIEAYPTDAHVAGHYKVKDGQQS
jgi:hypothetical protein